MSSRSIKSLRKRLLDQPTQADWLSLEEFKRPYLGTLFEVLRRITALDPPVPARVTARIKNNGTIVEKLRRDHTAIDRMRDIAGVRVVALEGGYLGLDQIVESLRRVFPESDLIDRRTRPTHGYRAIHLEVGVAGRLCEIQVRTPLQHRWAQLFEGLADRWGRQIRYGLPPEEPGLPEEFSRTEVLHQLEALSEDIHEEEQLTDPMLSNLSELDSFFESYADFLPQGDIGIWVPLSPQAIVAFRRSSGQLVDGIDLDPDSEQAAEFIEKMLARFAGDLDIEVVHLISDSSSSMKVTHARYFAKLRLDVGG